MAYLKDSAILILRATEDGYFVSAFQWNQSPPPIGTELALAIEARADVQPAFRQDRTSVTKTELKTELAAFIDQVFDV